MTTMDRRQFVRQAAVLGGGLFALGPLSAFYARTASGARLQTSGYGPLVLKGDLYLPAEFDYTVVSRQGMLMSDGRPTPGIFDGMGAFPGRDGSVVLIRNHENRERVGEQKVVTGAFEYDPAMMAGNTKVVVERDRATGAYTRHRESFAVLGGTSTNCAGGLRAPHTWITCEEVVKRGPTGLKHGYIFEIDSRADGPVQAVPVPQAGRLTHEAALERAGIVYLTEDRDLQPDPVLGTIGASFYRYVPSPRGGGVPLAETTGPLEALAIRGEPHANMDAGRVVGRPYPVTWVPVEDPDHDDDTDDRRDRVPGFTPTRIQAQDNGAAYFDRQEGMWAGRGEAKIYFDCTTGGPLNLGQVWEYDPGRETITLVYQSVSAATLEMPDNMVVVQQTGDIFLQEDSSGEQFVRGVTQDGEIYDFAKTAANQTEFAGGCFSPDGSTFFLNSMGERGGLPDGPPDQNAVTYAIYGPFEKRGR